eukprot:TRINITY_DN651_c0_g4_i1.p1 TRINITY_DN651_c0_g4~~TRINITY_DN651_c0_g4_i1.p1  ORF type:complete len:178 (-),score=72.12 TRINITY_DN651_c0_g4_i1:198-731(-)
MDREVGEVEYDDDELVEVEADLAEGIESAERHKGYTFEDVEQTSIDGPARSVEGYVLFVTGINEEADDMMIQELFGDYGAIKNLHINADHKTGFRKGYAFIEFEKLEEAQSALRALDNTEFLEKTLRVSFAFMQKPLDIHFELPQRERRLSGRRHVPRGQMDFDGEDGKRRRRMDHR